MCRSTLAATRVHQERPGASDLVAAVYYTVSVEMGAACAASYAAIACVLAQREADLVEAVEQALALEVVELEGEAARRARLEVDGQLLAAVSARHQLVHLLCRQRDRQQPDLERVLAEDVAERRRDHRVEAVVL